MTIDKFRKNIFSYIIIIFITACGGERTQIANLYDDTFSAEKDIICPKVRYIENLDRLKVTRNGEEIYTLNFYEVKWRCYSFSKDNENFQYNIDLDIKFKIDYNKNIKIYNKEKFNIIVTFMNADNVILAKEKFSRNLKSESKTSIISQNNLINITLSQTVKDLKSHQVLLGLIE